MLFIIQISLRISLILFVISSLSKVILESEADLSSASYLPSLAPPPSPPDLEFSAPSTSLTPSLTPSLFPTAPPAPSPLGLFQALHLIYFILSVRPSLCLSATTTSLYLLKLSTLFFHILLLLCLRLVSLYYYYCCCSSFISLSLSLSPPLTLNCHDHVIRYNLNFSQRFGFFFHKLFCV